MIAANVEKNSYQMLQEHGLRATPQRIAVADMLIHSPKHVTPQQVYETLKAKLPSISQNTIYLTLSSLEAAGLLRKLPMDGKSYFDSNTERHDHMHCRSCGKIEDIDSKDSPSLPRNTYGWDIQNDSRVWHGTCPECKNKGS